MEATKGEFEQEEWAKEWKTYGEYLAKAKSVFIHLLSHTMCIDFYQLLFLVSPDLSILLLQLIIPKSLSEPLPTII